MANTFTWTGGSTWGTIASDWGWVTGSVTDAAGPPGPGDTALVTSGTVWLPLDATLNGNTVEVAGTAGAAGLLFSGDAALNLTTPTIDQATTVESLVQGQIAAGATVLDTLGTFINGGTIEANGPKGSTFTIDVAQDTTGNAGVFINYNEIDVAAGNAMTIIAGTNAAFYNASGIQVAGGSLDLTTSGTGAFDGGYAPLRGVVVISQDGTVEDNIAYGTAVGGAAPYFAFADNNGNTLKLDQPAQFGGRILGFGAGDTIDLGQGLTVTAASYDAATGILALENGASTVASLAFVSGDFQTGSFAVSGGIAGSFGIATVGTDTVITTSATNEVWNSTGGGLFTAGTNWVGGQAPGPSSAVVIGLNGLSGAVTTGGASIAVQSLLFVGNTDTLVVSGSIGVGPAPLEQGGGTIEVTGGSTLGVSALSQIGGGMLRLDSGALMNVSGHVNYGYPNAGSITVPTGEAYGVLLQGSGLIDNGTLLSSGFVTIGVEGGGTPAQMTVTASGTVSDTSSVLNSGPTSFGSLTLTGSGTSWTDAGDPTDTLTTRGYMLVGYNGIGGAAPYAGAASLTIGNGATLTEAAYANIGQSANSAGIANVVSGGVWHIGLATGGYLDVGFYGAGTLDISAGGTVAVGGVGTFVSNGSTYTGGGIGIGHRGGSSGALNVTGGVLTSGAGIGVGEGGVGELTVSSGGAVTVTAGGIGVGLSAAVPGAVFVSGAGSEITTTGTRGGIAVGKAGPGSMTIADGGAVTIAGGNGLFVGGTGAGPVAGASGLVKLGALGGPSGGTLDVTGNAYVWAGSTLSVDSSSGVDIGTSGTFATGAVVVEAGHGLTGDGKIAAAVVNDGSVIAANSGTAALSTGGVLEIAGSLGGVGALVIDGGAALLLDGALGSGQTIDFTQGAPEALVLGSALLGASGGTIANAITGFVAGDRIEFGGLSGITAAGFNGTTLTVSGTSAGAPVTVQLTNVNAAAAGTSLLTGNDPATGSGYVQLLGSDVWQWKNDVSAAATIATNWTLLSGAGNTAGYPLPGDTAIVPFGTVVAPPDIGFTSNTIEVGGTTSLAAAVFTGDSLVTWTNPSIDFNSLIESNIGTQTTAEQSLLDIAGRFVNQGTIAANATGGGSFTIDVAQGSSGIAGAFINDHRIEIASGNAMTIEAGPTAAFFNAGQVEIKGGTLDLTTTGSGALAGGLAPTDGLFVLQSGATMEVNTGFPAGQTGSHPTVAFADTSGNLLKLDQPGQFGGRLLGFGVGDTIDLGAVNAGTLVVTADGVLTVEDTTGSLIASLVFTTGSYAPGTYAVSGSSAIAGGFTISGNGTDARITSDQTMDVWGGSTGTFSVGANWAGSTAPGATDTALIAGNSNTNYVVSTGAGAIAVGALVVADGNASLLVADAFSVTAHPVQAAGGTIEVLGGASLTARALDQSSAGASLLLDQGATLDLLGQPNLGFANAGTLIPPTGGTIGLLAMGSVVVTGAVLNAGPGQAGGSGGFIAIGKDGGGTGAAMLVQSGPTQGATVTDTYAYLSSDPTSFGSLTISGTLTSWTDAGDPADAATTRGYMIVGGNDSSTLVPYAGTASLLVTNQATLAETSYAVIGSTSDSAGSATVSGQAMWDIGTATGQPGFLDVGNSGLGSLLVTDNGIGGQGGTVAVGGGGTIVSQGVTKVAPTALDIGHHAGASGAVTVSGGSSTLNVAGAVVVGDAGQGALTIRNGGQVDVTTASAIVVGATAGGNGLLAVDGPGSALFGSSASLTVGAGGAGGLAAGNSGIVSVDTATVNTLASLDSGGALYANAVTITAGGRIDGANGAVISSPGTVTNLGTIEVTAGAFTVNATLAGSGVVQIDPGATVVVEGTMTGTDSFVFASGGAPGELVLEQPGSALPNPVQNLQSGDIIELANFSTITGASLTSAGTVTVTGTVAGVAASYQLTDVTFAPGASTNFLITSVIDPYTSTPAQAVELACFAAGTRLATAHGAVAVERLRPGDRLRTAGGALRPVRWIGWRTIDLTRHPDPRRAQPIRILADAFADGVPARDLLLSPDHAVFDRGRLIPIRLLVNDATIRRETRRRKVTYFHVELDSHDLLLAEGLAAESYLDTGNRGIFENADEPLILHPDLVTKSEQNRYRLAASCAPLADAPADVEPPWWRLADRAQALGFVLPEPALTEDAALSVQVGGRRLRPLAQQGTRYRFALPAGPAWLVSRAAYPADARPWVEDQRRLGVMVRRLTLYSDGRAAPLPLDDPALGRGWWAPETDGVSHWRWTDGAATLPVLERPTELEVELAGRFSYPLPAVPAGRRRAAAT